MEIVINKCYGGFGLSYKAMMRYAEIKKIKLYAFVNKLSETERYSFDGLREYDGKSHAFCIHYSTAPLKNGKVENGSYFFDSNIKRNDPTLIQVVKELGKEANGDCAELKIIKIPDNIEYQIEEYDGQEWVAEKHNTWG